MRSIFSAAGLLSAVLLLAPSVRASEEPPEGHHLVGHFTRLLNVKGTTFDENRPVIVHLWYPAQGPKDCDNSLGNRDNQRCSRTPSIYTSRLYGVSLGNLGDPLSWTISGIQSFDNLRITTEDGPFPAIIFSHGSPGNVIQYLYMLEALASSGFIVAAPDHLNDTTDDVLIDYVNSLAGVTVIPCFDAFPGPCWRTGSAGGGVNTLKDRAHDISAVITALPTWFGNQVDVSRVGVMGHSRGGLDVLVAAGGSPQVPGGDPRVKAIVGLAPSFVPVNIQKITVPAVLMVGALDNLVPFDQFTRPDFNGISSKKKELNLIGQATHRHFGSAACAITQSSGAVATKNSRAILDLQTFRRNVLVLPPVVGSAGVAMDYCGFDTFTKPVDVRSLVFSLTGFSVSSNNVPTTGLLASEVKEEVTDVAVGFFERNMP
jgi:predicted dienelactone hydrolase